MLIYFRVSPFFSKLNWSVCVAFIFCDHFKIFKRSSKKISKMKCEHAGICKSFPIISIGNLKISNMYNVFLSQHLCGKHANLVKFGKNCMSFCIVLCTNFLVRLLCRKFENMLNLEGLIYCLYYFEL